MISKQTGYPSIDLVHLKDTSFWERHPYIPSISISNAIDFMFANKGSHFVVECHDLHITHKQFKQDAIILSRAFLQLGAKPNDIICVSMPNYYQALVAFKAANRIGVTLTFLNPFSSEEELEKYLLLYHSRILINFDKPEAYNLRLKAHTELEYIITLNIESLRDSSFRSKNNDIDYSNGLLDYRDLEIVSSKWSGRVKTLFGGQQVALILYTSGSTGEPKSMVFTNENILSTLFYYKNTMCPEKVTEENRRWMCVVPFMYPYGFAMSVLVSILGGYEALLAPEISAETINEYYAKKPYLVFGSPAFLEMTKRNMDKDLQVPSLKYFISGGDFLPASQLESGKAFFKEHGADVEICNGSGNGELLGCCTISIGAPIRTETVGRLVVGPEYVILDPDSNEEVPYGEPGILCASGKHVFKGYYNNQALTDEAMIEYKGKRYYKTGNYGFLDRDRYFTMIGRASRFYITSTLNKVYCELVQKIIAQIDVVDTCAVVPKPDKDVLFVSKAYVVLKEGNKASDEMEQYIIRQSKEPHINPVTGEMLSLKDYEAPQSVTFLDSLPRNELSGKIDYLALEKMAATE